MILIESLALVEDPALGELGFGCQVSGKQTQGQELKPETLNWGFGALKR